MDLITIVLNGREVSGYPNMTVLELARESGIEIPTLCHDPHLHPAGACRICLVEDERSGKLLASCVTPIESGMMINTTSPRVLERRKVIIELILASHPDSCLVCDKGNDCELRRIASDMGVGLVHLQKIHQSAAFQDVNPFIERDLSKCILCAKCIRADHEIVVEGAIDYIDRGFSSKPATLNNTPLEKSDCTFCGTCVALCPTGALIEKDPAYRGTTATTVTTICPFCGCGCSVCMEIRCDRIVRARPDKESAVNHGALCVKGSYGYDFVHSQERLTSPLRRANGGFEEISWEQALDIVATELRRIKGANGPNSLAVLGSSKCTNEENYLLQRFARGVLGTNNIDNGSRLYSSASYIGLGQTIGFPGTTSTLDKLEHSDAILVIGANPASSAPIVGYAIKRAVKYKDAKLLLVDPQQTKLAAFANLWLKPKVGTDIALLNGLARVIITENLWDEEFVARTTDNFEALRKGLEPYTPEYVEKVTGIPIQELSQAARLLAEANQASIVYGSGITQYVTGTDSVMALANLAMLTGNIGPRGGGIYALQRDNNGQGACDMGALPDFLPGYRSVGDAQSRKSFGERWEVSLPAGEGLTALEMIAQVRDGGIKAMYIVGENPALSFPHLGLVKEALASLDFLVVEDMFLTETAKLAAVILPAASFAEKEGTFTNFEGRVQRTQKAITSPGSSLPDWEIVLRLASKMNSPMPYSSPQQVMDEIKEMVPFYQDTVSDSEVRRLSSTKMDDSLLGSRRLYGGQFPKGFGRFLPIKHYPLAETPVDGYLFTLLSGTIPYHSGSGVRSSRAPRLEKFQSEAFIEINESDAKRLGIGPNDKINVISPISETIAKARISDTAPEGLLFMPISFSESLVNALFDVSLDPRSKTPALKACAVRLERIETSG
ncbi:formate dehydrogenase subunit alpha [Chloroflexota bacterium]